jgi:hypothetical protein
MHGPAVVKLEAAEFFGGVMRQFLPRRREEREDEEEALFGSMTSFAHERHGRNGSN